MAAPKIPGHKISVAHTSNGVELHPSFRKDRIKRAKWAVAQFIDEVLTAAGMKGDFLARARLGLLSKAQRTFFMNNPLIPWTDLRLETPLPPGLALLFQSAQIPPLNGNFGQPFKVMSVNNGREPSILADSIKPASQDNLFYKRIEIDNKTTILFCADRLDTGGRIGESLILPTYRLTYSISYDDQTPPFLFSHTFTISQQVRLVINGKTLGFFAQYDEQKPAT